MSQFVLKVHSRCDLACDHCYMYKHVDQTWRHRPAAMTPQIVQAAAARMAEHAAARGLKRVRAVLHGGEPLLLGHAGLSAVLEQLTETVGSVAELEIGMQTNGVRLTTEICDLLVRFGVRVGVSLDGDAAANDRHRRFAGGASSHEQVLRALELLRQPEYRQIYGGILCTVDIAGDPVAVYNAIAAQEPPRVDFLLPHATWDRPPARGANPTPYADWLGAIYDRWQGDGRPMPIRMFDSLRALAAGGWSATESLGLAPVDLVVVETDGTWEQADSLKTAYHGAAGTDLNVFAHSVDDVTGHPGILSRQGNIADLCDTCQSCPVVRSCGGGLYAHRYRSGNGFDNPSVYCDDLKALILATERKGHRPPRSRGEVVELPPGMIEDLGTGYGDADSMEFLATSQLSITRSLVTRVGKVALRSSADPIALTAIAGLEALADVDFESPDAVTRVMRHPYVRAWAMRCLHAKDATTAGRLRAYLSNLAAAAAIHAGRTVRVPILVEEESLVLPTLGRISVPELTSDLVEVTTFTRGLIIHSGFDRIIDFDVPATESGPWQPVRQIDLPGISLVLEDTDPYRDCFKQPPAPRLSIGAAQIWYQQLADALSEIDSGVPGQRAGIAAALRSVVPLRPDPAGAQLSSAARNAFGAVAIASLANAEPLAVLLVHEIQHVKLAALLDLCELVDDRDPILLRVPWRDDPRPPEMVLQGTYAHLSVADVWRARCADGSSDPQTPQLFGMYRDWTTAGIAVLRDCGALMPLGLELLERMDRTVRSWCGDGL